MGRVELPGGLQGLRAPTTQELLQGLMEQAEWPIVSEWLVLEHSKFNVLRTEEGTRILQIWCQGQRTGYRLPLPPIAAAILSRDLGSGEALEPESEEVAKAGEPEAPQPESDDPPAPPTMGQSPPGTAVALTRAGTSDDLAAPDDLHHGVPDRLPQRLHLQRGAEDRRADPRRTA